MAFKILKTQNINQTYLKFEYPYGVESLTMPATLI